MIKELSSHLPAIKSAGLLLLLIPVMAFNSINSFAQENIHGFRLIEKRFVKEVNANCLYYEHIKSGARLMKIEADDENKTFGITFKTVPSSDNGVAHIMEHSVLNGSVNFPAKSPFDILSKGSLKTFLNAMTGRDATAYPVASMNEKDYFNLMNVYLDAVFFPMLYTDPRILKQEGWHYELTDKDAPVVCKGVVFNEMKGAYSNPQREVRYQLLKNLFPDNVYGWESGGLPSAIPTLTQEEFVAFHKKFYHPENSYIFLYGNAPTDKELEFIDKSYLSKFTRGGFRAKIEDQAAFDAPKEVTSTYPVLEGETKGKTFLSKSFVIGHNTDYTLSMALDILAEVLVNQESAPLRLAFQKAGIGKDVYASVSNYKQNVFTITVLNAEPSDKENFASIVMDGLKSQVANGVDKSEVEGVLSRLEFYLREGNSAQKGINYMNQNISGWFFDDDPFSGLEYEKMLSSLKDALKTNYLEKIIQDGMLANPHALLLVVEPQEGLDAERNAANVKALAEYKASLSPGEIDKMIADTKSLIEYQNADDSPEAVATIPMLSLSDISPKAAFYDCEVMDVKKTPVLYRKEFTNGILYTRLQFDMRTLTEQQLPYAALLSDLLGAMSTENYTYGKLNHAFNVNTGGFYTSIQTYTPDFDDNNLMPKFCITTKVMKEKAPAMFELAGEVLLKSLMDDTARLHELISRRCSQLQSSMNQDGFNVAASRLPSYFSREGVFNQITSGLDYYWFITKLNDNFNAGVSDITRNLKAVADQLFTRDNLMVNITCEEKDLPEFNNRMSEFAQKLPQRKVEYQTWNLKPEVKNEGILAASKVQYVIAGFNFRQLGYKWNGNMRVLSQVISSEWLHNQIRVIGGAYGGYCRLGADGTVTFNSYRDPGLNKTIETYQKTGDFLKNLKVDDLRFTRYIIGTIASLDMPLTASQRGTKSFDMYLFNRKQSDVQEERNAILRTTVADIVPYADMIDKIMEQGAVCVFGNTQKVTAEQEHLKNLIKVDM